MSTKEVINPIIQKYLDNSQYFDEIARMCLIANLDKVQVKSNYGTWKFIPSKPPSLFNKIPVIVDIDLTHKISGIITDGMVK